ncbi:MAG: high-potential iron-sulfur protein [Candidatus Obscuribacterales bacterium]|nr:high-potential iron-sulfur protein [Steroidobacteraceae bacterium]
MSTRKPLVDTKLVDTKLVDGRRRDFCRQVAGAAVGAFAVAAIGQSAVAADLPPLKETDSTASMMGYKEDTTKVDAKKHPNHKPTQTCANCQFYQGDKAAARGPCTIFAGKSVAAKGWCQVWAVKA